MDDAQAGEREQREPPPEAFNVPGPKNKRPVRIIVPGSIVPSVKLIVKSRRQVGVPDPRRGLDVGNGRRRVVPPGTDPEAHNRLLFPRLGSSKPYSITALLRRFRDKIKTLRRPDLMTANGLRHHAATKTELLGEDEKKVLARHMDHSLGTQRLHYTSNRRPPDFRPLPTEERCGNAPPGPITLRPGTAEFADYVTAELRAFFDGQESNRRAPEPSETTTAEMDTSSDQLEVTAEDSPDSAGETDDVVTPRDFQPPTSPEASTSTATVSGFRYWDDAETCRLMSLFPDHLRDGRNPTRLEVAEVVRQGRGLPGRSAESMRQGMINLIKGVVRKPQQQIPRIP